MTGLEEGHPGLKRQWYRGVALPQGSGGVRVCY
ncbi:MAG: hypothetical protein QOF31_5759, partial [Mycobacterium sp.]|nr:hypothetical protein [Mycobacterium sp.]